MVAVDPHIILDDIVHGLICNLFFKSVHVLRLLVLGYEESSRVITVVICSLLTFLPLPSLFPQSAKATKAMERCENLHRRRRRV
jgi:hypothetical protein